MSQTDNKDLRQPPRSNKHIQELYKELIAQYGHLCLQRALLDKKLGELEAHMKALDNLQPTMSKIEADFRDHLTSMLCFFGTDGIQTKQPSDSGASKLVDSASINNEQLPGSKL